MLTVKKRFPAYLLIILTLLMGWPGVSQAQGQGLSFIRDAEIEDTIRIFSAPLFRAVGLEPNDVKIFLINDSTLNAFVTDGQKYLSTPAC